MKILAFFTKKTILFLCLIICSYTSPNDLRNLVSEIKMISEQLKTITTNNDKTKGKELKRRINNIKLWNKIEGLRISEDAQNYLKIKILHLNIDLELFIIQNKIENSYTSPIFWCDLGDDNKTDITDLNHLKKQLGRLKYTHNLYKYKSDFKRKIKLIDKRVLKNIGISPSDDSLLEKEWYFVHNSSKSKILKGEKYTYDLITPNKTIKQLSKFITFSKYAFKDNNNEIPFYNDFANIAFKQYYETLTFDGEESTLIQFEEHIPSTKNSMLKILFNLIKNDFEEDLNRASLVSDTINSNKIYDFHDYEKIIKVYAPKEIAFVALQKSIADYILKEDFDSALKIIRKVKDRFLNKAYSFTEEKVLNLEKQIIDIQSYKNKIQISFLPLHKINTQKDEMKFRLNQEYNKILLIPNNNYEKNKLFVRTGSSWNNSPISSTSATHYNHIINWFDKNNSATIIQMQANEDFNANKLFEGSNIPSSNKIITDFHISYRGKVAFFVSNAPKYRKLNKPEFEKDRESFCKNLEYSSPGFIDPLLSLQELELDEKFHGKQYGNANTDIYYCIKKGNVWGIPKLLEKVNTPFSERSPFLSNDGTKLFFSSEGHGGLGGYDVFSVRIQKNDNEIQVLSKDIKNITHINSPYDEIYYQEEDTDNAYLSSNRNKNLNSRFSPIDFNIYKVNKKLKSNRRNNNIRPNKGVTNPTLKNSIPILLSDSIKIEFKCFDLPERKEVPNNHIIVTGKIYGSDGKLLPKAEVIFSSKDFKQYYDEVDLSNSIDSSYTVVVPDNAKYYVQVYGYYKNGVVVNEFTDNFIAVCENKQKGKYVLWDQKLTKMNSLKQQQEPTKFPFFFETAKSEISTLQNLGKLKEIYIPFAENFKQNHNAYFLLTGYADFRGGECYNCELAKKRACSVKKFFEDLGIPSANLQTFTVGETQDFSNDKISNFLKYLDLNDNKVKSQDDFKLLLNRRVQVLFVNGKSPYNKEPSCLPRCSKISSSCLE